MQEIFNDSLKHGLSEQKRQMLLDMIAKTNLQSLSGEVMRLAALTKPLLSHDRKDSMISYLASLDFLLKGLYSHWQVRLRQSTGIAVRTVGKSAYDLVKSVDVKYPILIGDQFHAKALYMSARMGNNEFVKVLAAIEENF